MVRSLWQQNKLHQQNLAVELVGDMGAQTQGLTPFVTFYSGTCRTGGLSMVGISLVLSPHTR